jgi:hypothetical protein
MSASDSQSTDQLDFVTMQGLLAYGEVLAQRTSSGRFVLPPPPRLLPTGYRAPRRRSAGSEPSFSRRRPVCTAPRPIARHARPS